MADIIVNTNNPLGIMGIIAFLVGIGFIVFLGNWWGVLGVILGIILGAISMSRGR